jgi:serine/threonine protein phosphatase PrpC
MTIRYAARTDVGMRRTHNEDCFGILEAESLVLVADGMGGHAAGEIASALATTEVCVFYHRSHNRPEAAWPFEREATLSLLENRLSAGFKVANQAIFDMANGDKGRKGMGTTLVAAAIVDDEICIAHVGDSRAYRIHNAAIERLTRDHSLLEQFKELYPEMTTSLTRTSSPEPSASVTTSKSTPRLTSCSRVTSTCCAAMASRDISPTRTCSS